MPCVFVGFNLAKQTKTGLIHGIHNRKGPSIVKILRNTTLLLLAHLAGAMLQAKDLDLLLVNGNVYTLNERQSHAEAIGVKRDRIVFVGSTAEAKKLAGAKTRVIDLHDHT